MNLDLDQDMPETVASVETAPNAPAPPPAERSVAPEAKTESTPAAAPPAPSVVDELSRRVERLRERVEGASLDKMADDLKDLKVRVGRMAEAEGPAEAKVGEIDGRVAGLGREFRALQAEFKTIREAPRPDAALARPEKQVEALKAKIVPALRSPERLSAGLIAFREKRFAAAASEFRSAASAGPDDARAWYFAAIAHGLATNDWKGEAEALVLKGVALEKAGTPTPAEIDAALSELTRETGKDWLGYYRARTPRK